MSKLQTRITKLEKQNPSKKTWGEFVKSGDMQRELDAVNMRESIIEKLNAIVLGETLPTPEIDDGANPLRQEILQRLERIANADKQPTNQT